MARKQAPKKSPALGTAPTPYTPEQFAELCEDAHTNGVLGPWPIPPNPVPGGWWADVFAAWLRAALAPGPILLRP